VDGDRPRGVGLRSRTSREWGIERERSSPEPTPHFQTIEIMRKKDTAANDPSLAPSAPEAFPSAADMPGVLKEALGAVGAC